MVVRPPAGLLVMSLPPYYTTVWIGGIPYDYANDVYYRWAPEQGGYEVVDPPAGADQPTAAPTGRLPPGVVSNLYARGRSKRRPQRRLDPRALARIK